MKDHLKVVVIGAGIIGASIAWHLVRLGARVTVVDSGETGGIATRKSWAWINASWGNAEPYFRLRVQAMEEWRRLEYDLPGLKVAWTGGLNWELPGDELEAFAIQHANWGYNIRRVGQSESQRIEPNLIRPPNLAVYASREGAIEPLVVTQQLLSAAWDCGAKSIVNNAVRSVRLHAGRVRGIETDLGYIEADRVVVAAGAGAVAIASTVGIMLPISAPPALLVVTRPHAKLLNGLIMTPTIQLRQSAEGRLVAAAGLKGVDLEDDGAAAAAAAFAEMRSMFSSTAELKFDYHAVGYRPIPRDGLPILGASKDIDGLYVAATHSGITLAPAIGRFLAEEIVVGRRNPLIETFGLDRLSNAKP